MLKEGQCLMLKKGGNRGHLESAIGLQLSTCVDEQREGANLIRDSIDLAPPANELSIVWISGCLCDYL